MDKLNVANDNAPNFVLVDDPKKAGFNYGTGWAPRPFPMEYHLGNIVADALRETAHYFEARSWSYDMALRDMRHADTQEEFDNALGTFRRVRDRIESELGLDKTKPKWDTEALVEAALEDGG